MCGHRQNRAELGLIKHPIRIHGIPTWLQRFKMVSEEEIPTSLKINSILTMAAHNEKFASRGEKYQTCLTFSSRPREANFSLKVPRTREETAEQTAS